MTTRPQAEVSRIREHVAALRELPWLGQARRWWPRFLFHCTDIQNVVRILRAGELLSRVQAEVSGSLQVDIAAPEIIAHTATESKNHVRLYFRPKTPTQYANEGFRPPGQRRLDAHCPVPIYLLFDSISVLSLTNSLFTAGNAARGAQPIGDMGKLGEIPFDLVYHDTWLDPQERNKIVYHRNAEVLIPQRMGLDVLKYIVCRSQAEYETLLYLLPNGVRSRWVDKIRVRPGLFLRNWTFVEQVEMTSQRLVFRFNKDTETPGPFEAKVEIFEPLVRRSKEYLWHNEQFQADDVLNVGLHNLQNSSDYTALLSLDGQLAFANRYQEESLPF